MVAIHALIDNCKEFIAPIGSVLLHPLIGNKLHIFADDCHALRVEPVSYTHLTLPTSDLV